MKAKIGMGIGLALLGMALAANSLRLVIDGKASGSAITVGGQIYVPLSALEAAGVPVTVAGGAVSLALHGSSAAQNTPAGGANGIAALSGCLNQTLFNGVWRIKFSNLRLSTDDSTDLRWLIDLQASNGTSSTLQGIYDGLNSDQAHLNYFGSDGTPFDWSVHDSLAGQTVELATLPPGAVWRGTLSIHDPNGATRSRPPVKLLWQVKPSEASSSHKLPWSTKDPSFRVDLTCTK